MAFMGLVLERSAHFQDVCFYKGLQKTTIPSCLAFPWGFVGLSGPPLGGPGPPPWGPHGRFYGHDEQRSTPSWLTFGRRLCLAKMGGPDTCSSTWPQKLARSRARPQLTKHVDKQKMEQYMEACNMVRRSEWSPRALFVSSVLSFAPAVRAARWRYSVVDMLTRRSQSAIALSAERS